MNKATWEKRGKTVKGVWIYHWASDTFYIRLDSIDLVTGQTRKIEVHGESPEWNGWKLVQEKSKPARRPKR